MGVYIPGITIADLESLMICEVQSSDGSHRLEMNRKEIHPVEIPMPHGRLIDADKLCQAMYHEAFETDSDMQKWDSGCWIRYKMFENHEAEAPTVIDAEG